MRFVPRPIWYEGAHTPLLLLATEKESERALEGDSKSEGKCVRVCACVRVCVQMASLRFFREKMVVIIAETDA